MRKLVFILIAFIAAVTFIRAFDRPTVEKGKDLGGVRADSSVPVTVHE